jgi:tetratricopeptide (TPR) repeat protein
MLPVFYILLQEGLHNLFVTIEGKKGLSYSPIIALVVVVGFAYYTYRGEVEQITRYSELENGLVEKMKIGASWFKNKQVSTGKQLTVAATTIGAFSYYSDVTLIDMLGLCDKEIAHNPKPIEEISANSEIGWKERHYNVDYVLSRKPDYIYFSTGLKPSAYAERGLFTSEEFIKYYYPTYFVLKDYNFSDVTYKRKSEQDAAKSPAPQTNPNYKKTFVNLYTQAMNTGKDNTKMQEAITLYQQSADQGPGNWGAPYNKIGDLYLQAKDKEKAFENFKKAVDINDFNVLSHYSLFQLYMQRGDTVNARTSYDKVYKYAPEMVR